MVPTTLIDTVISAEDKSGWYGDWVLKILDDASAVTKLTDEVLEVLPGRVMTTRQIRSELGLEGAQAEALKYLISDMTGRRLITSAGVAGGWRSNQFGYALWEDWFPDTPRRVLDPDRARADIADWFLRGHGPGTLEDFKWWSGLKKPNASKALEESSGVLIDDRQWDLPDRATPRKPSGVRLLPVWDTAIVTQLDRRRMIDERHYRFVYDRDGNATSTIAVDGEVVGVWDRKGDDKHLFLKAAPLEAFGADDWSAVEAEAAVLGAALGVGDVTVERFEVPVDLQAAGRNRFLSPLSGT
jgi:hypothetical protein